MSLLKYISFFIFCCALLSCSEEETPPFTTGSRFSYATSYTTPDGRITRYDTLSFTIQVKDVTSYSLGLKKIRWENTRHSYYQVRGLNIKDDLIELQLPLNYPGFSQELIAVPGHPTVSLTGGPGYTLEEEDTYVQAYGALSGLTIKQHAKYLRDTTIFFDGEAISCKLHERYNTSHKGRFGRYYMLYTYNPAYGFITIECLYPNGKYISLRLTDISIEGR